jgi:hypothetical protein
MDSRKPASNSDRVYYTTDKTLFKQAQIKLHKDLEACLRCGFTLKEIRHTLSTRDSEYSDIINKEE